MSNSILKFILFFLLFMKVKICFGAKPDLEKLNEDETLSLIRSEKFVIVLFTKPNCAECDKYENALLGIREDLVDSLSAWVVKAENSNVVKLYNPTKEPALVFFRHGVPLLYDGEINEELILHVFTENKEPVVKELSDDNFEILTQAATGATTGDWFIMFYTSECVDCQRLQARWEAVGAKLKTRLNVARINKKKSGATARRFGIPQVPYFLFFRLGKMYHYNIQKHDVTSFVAFATDWYKNARSEKVPIPKSPFDDLVQEIADYLKETPMMLRVGFSFIVILFLYALYACCLRSKTPEKPKKGKDSGKSAKVDKTKKVK